MLGEVVASWKPLVTREADRYIVQVEDSYLVTGHSGVGGAAKIARVMGKSRYGSIRIIGGQSVTVMINDVVQRMSSRRSGGFSAFTALGRYCQN